MENRTFDETEQFFLNQIQHIISRSRQIKYKRARISKLNKQKLSLTATKHKTFWYIQYKIQEKLKEHVDQIHQLIKLLDEQHEKRFN